MYFLEYFEGEREIKLSLNTSDKEEFKLLNLGENTVFQGPGVLISVPKNTVWRISDDKTKPNEIDDKKISLSIDENDVAELVSILRDVLNAGNASNLVIKHRNRIKYHHKFFKDLLNKES